MAYFQVTSILWSYKGKYIMFATLIHVHVVSAAKCKGVSLLNNINATIVVTIHLHAYLLLSPT